MVVGGGNNILLGNPPMRPLHDAPNTNMGLKGLYLTVFLGSWMTCCFATVGVAKVLHFVRCH